VRLLYISSFYLFPETRFGGSKRLYYFARAWEKTAQLSLICMDANREWSGQGAPATEFRDFLMVPGCKVPGLTGRITRPPADRREALEEHGDRIRAFLRGKEFDAIILAFPWALSYLGGYIGLSGKGMPIAYLEDDLFFEQFRMESRAGSNPLKRAWKYFRYRQTLAYYRPLMEWVTRFIGISAQEADLVRKHFPRTDARVVQYGIPMEEYPELPPPKTGKAIGFIGNYAHPPNRDALEWLTGSLAAAIRAECPDVRFILAGKGIPASAKEKFAPGSFVEFREDVADLRDFYSDIQIFINPIVSGRGMRTKLIEAAAFGRPILTTSLGGEGLECLEMSIADDEKSMVNACARFYEEDAGGPSRVARNRRIVAERFSLEKVAGDFLSMLGATAGSGAPV
jgi:glycosyltransferase involved in cell wall biosynthesis